MQIINYALGGEGGPWRNFSAVGGPPSTEVGTKKNRTGKDDFVALVIFAVPGLYQIVFTSVLLQYNTTLAFG